MHVSYEYEQKLKQDYLNELFKPFVSNVKLNATFEPTHYRNKCQMTYKLLVNINNVKECFVDYLNNLNLYMLNHNHIYCELTCFLF